MLCSEASRWPLSEVMQETAARRGRVEVLISTLVHSDICTLPGRIFTLETLCGHSCAHCEYELSTREVLRQVAKYLGKERVFYSKWCMRVLSS